MENGDFEKLINALAAAAAGYVDRKFNDGIPAEIRIVVQPDGSGAIKIDAGERRPFNGPHTAAELLREFIENAK
jgi:hypothetical protein